MAKKSRFNLLIVATTALFAGNLIFAGYQASTGNKAHPPLSAQSTHNSDAVLANAFSNHLNNLQVSGQGVVTSVLPNDNSGTRHQRFILKLESGQTLLVAHNIDIAPGISNLRENDTVQFYGEYEWNDKGGVIHYTHKDPKGVHAAGWLEHQGIKYQ
jgi:hypothetical protein